MTHELNMADNGILRITISGDLDRSMLEPLRKDYQPFLDASTVENPLNNLMFTENLGKISSAARKYLTDLNKSPKYGLVAFVNAPRRVRVLGKFILKATNRKNLKFFESEEQALEWLKP